MREIRVAEKLVAVVYDGVFAPGTQPLTDEKLPLQIIGLKHPKGKMLVAHTHEPKQRITDRLVECLMLFSGRVRATVYHDTEIVEKIELTAGQGLMIVDGGVGYEILEEATMMEFKNGPFLEDKIIIS